MSWNFSNFPDKSRCVVTEIESNIMNLIKYGKKLRIPNFKVRSTRGSGAKGAKLENHRS